MNIHWGSYFGTLVTVTTVGTPLFSAVWMATNFWMSTGRDEYRQLVDQWAAGILIDNNIQPPRFVVLSNFFQGVFNRDQTISNIQIKVKNLYRRARVANPEEWHGRYEGIRSALPPGSEVGGAGQARHFLEETVERYEQKFGLRNELECDAVEWLATASDLQGPKRRVWLALQPEKWNTFKAYASFLPSYLDYTGRGTALGLLLGLAVDRISKTGTSWTTLLPMILGVSGSFLHGIMMASRAAVAEGVGKNPWSEAFRYGLVWAMMLAIIAAVPVLAEIH